MTPTILLLLTFSYLAGSIPCGLLLGRLKGIDVRSSGSGNIGATNVNRQLGRAMGFLTLVGDAAKAVIPMIIARHLLPETDHKALLVTLCGLAAFLGHLFPLYLKFKGGKGVATALGIMLYLNPLAALLLVLVFIAAVTLSGYVSVGSLTAALAMPVLYKFTGASQEQSMIMIIMTALVWFQHRDNIARLRQGSEKSWKKKAAGS